MVYGDMLSFFPEQFRVFKFFQMKPQPVSSYSKRYNEKDVRGILQYMKKDELRREEDTLADVNVPTFWTRTKLPVVEGFLEKDEELYKIVNPSDWHFEGGFYIYVLETFVGNSDVQKPFEDVDIGQNGYV